MIDEPTPQPLEAIPTASEPNIIEPRGINARRTNALSKAVGVLKQLQNETRAIEVEFFEHVYRLETDFQRMHDFVYQRRCEIVNGKYVPADDKEIKSTDEKQQIDSLETTKSVVPQFWLNVLSSSLPDIHENDRLILQHLVDVRCITKPLPDLGFILEFHFAPNEFFENTVLRKEYFYTSSDNKMIHEIPLIRRSLGCEINWKQGKVPAHSSWFEFLASSKIISDSDEDFMAYISGIQKDFEMGYFIKEHVIPKAVLYFTGEEKTSFTICNYNPGFWSPVSSESSTTDGISSEDETQSRSENKAEDQGKIPAEDE